MADTTIEDVEATIEAQTTEAGSFGALVGGIRTLVGEALYGEPISPAGNGKLNRIWAKLKDSEEGLVAAMTANTPASKAVGAAVTSITVTSAPNPSTVGKPVVFTAVVMQGAATPPASTMTPSTPAPASTPAAPVAKPVGLVKFMDGAEAIGSAKLDASGKATLTKTFDLAGSYAITAVYAGDSVNAGSTSTVMTQTVS